MCGITGCVDFFSKIDKKDLRKSLQKIAYRGPDSSGEYYSKHVALGIRRLSIIDLSTGNQPISNEDRTITVVFNGEIYNYRELREKLLKDHKFKTSSDTEVLVHLYEKYKEEMPKYLNGMFAFAIWDQKKQQLFLARDHCGIKPLYYWQQGGKLVFGSELKTILSCKNILKIPDLKSISLYAFLGYIPGTNSGFKNIKKLAPGHSLVFSNKGIKIKKYFFPKNRSFMDTDNLFKTVIQSQSVSDVPLGVFLSGGLDSSLISYYLSRGKKLKTFSISFKEKSFNEGGFAKEMAKALGTDHRSETFSPKDVISIFPKIIKELDEPLADPSFFPTYKISRFARRYVKVVLSGDGGDELFGGYPTYQGHLVAEKLGFLPGFSGSLISKTLSFFPRTFENYPKTEVMETFFNGLGKDFTQRHIIWMSLFALQPQTYTKLLKPPFFLDTDDLISELDLKEHPKIDKRKQAQLIDLNTYLVDDLLTKVDRASMFNSLEVRVPFLDRDVIDFALFTNKNHFDFLETKKILRNLLADKIPQTAVKRKKKGFGIPVSNWISDELKEFAYETIQNKNLDNFFNRSEITNLWDAHQAKRANNGKIIWMMVMLSGWLKNWGKL